MLKINLDKILWIFDARPWKSATANKLKGKGFENKEYYPTCKLKFLDIPNISKVSNSYKKMMELCLKYLNIFLQYLVHMMINKKIIITN